MSPLDQDQVHTLLAADKDELYSLLGAASLGMASSPTELLEAGRRGQFYATGPSVLGPDVPFDHKGLKKSAEKFLLSWSKEIKKAICGNDKLYAAEKKEAGRQVDVWVATIVSTLTVSIQALAPFTVVLNILAVMIVRSGLKAFCAEVLPAIGKN